MYSKMSWHMTHRTPRKTEAPKCGYQGLFFEFVQAVLPIVRKLAPDMPCPGSRLAEDIFVFKVVTSLRRMGGRRQERRKRPRKVARDKAFLHSCG
jgi:hypothetical protein